jgi:hypothetical protein
MRNDEEQKKGQSVSTRHPMRLALSLLAAALAIALGFSTRSGGQFFAQNTSSSPAAMVVEAMRASWNAYETCAYGRDELQPLSCTGGDWFHTTLTAVDSLDTLLIMEMEDEYLRAVEMIEKEAFVRIPGNCNVFEATIRVVGGCLSAYYEALGPRWLGSPRVRASAPILLNLAVDVGSRLIKAFDDSPTALPLSDVDLATGTLYLSVSFGVHSRVFFSLVSCSGRVTITSRKWPTDILQGTRVVLLRSHLSRK